MWGFVAIPDIQAISVADISFRAWIKRYGCPLEVHSDQGKQSNLYGLIPVLSCGVEL
jgi:hypothetical protein